MLNIFLIISSKEEQDAATQIFEQYYPRIKYIALQILRNPEDAEDVAMDVMLNICKNPERFLDYATSKHTVHLLFIMARNIAIDLYRRKQKHSEIFLYSDEDVPLLDMIPNGEKSIPDMVISDENRAYMMRAIDQLDDRYKIPFLLRYYNGLTNTEIADFLHLEVNLVNSRLFRAKKKIQENMLEMGYTHD